MSKSAVKTVSVAVGVVLDEQGRVLIARRASNAHQGGLWEFPGGKIEQGETVEQALARELNEELALTVELSTPLLAVEHDYGDKKVLLDVRQVEKYSGEPRGCEGQPIEWVSIPQLLEYAFPMANKPIIQRLIDIGKQRA